MDHNIEDILTLQPDQLHEDQVSFLKDNMDSLDEEAITKYNLNPESAEGADAEGGDAEGGDGGEGDQEDTFDADKYEVSPVKKIAKVEIPEVKIEGDEFDEESQKRFNQVVDQKMSTVLQQQGQQDLYNNAVSDMRNFVAENPDFKPYSGGVQKHLDFVADDGSKPYVGIPAKDLFKIVAGDDLMKIGARRERELQTKAKDTQTKQSPAKKKTPVSKGKDPLKMTTAEFNAKRAEVLGYNN